MKLKYNTCKALVSEIDILINNAGANIVSPVDTGKKSDEKLLVPNTKNRIFGLDTYDEQFALNVRPVSLTTVTFNEHSDFT